MVSCEVEGGFPAECLRSLLGRNVRAEWRAHGSLPLSQQRLNATLKSSPLEVRATSLV